MCSPAFDIAYDTNAPMLDGSRPIRQIPSTGVRMGSVHNVCSVKLAFLTLFVFTKLDQNILVYNIHKRKLSIAHIDAITVIRGKFVITGMARCSCRFSVGAGGVHHPFPTYPLQRISLHHYQA